jgi:hypothetical protein
MATTQQLEKIFKKIVKKAKENKGYDDYYQGRHKLNFASRAFNNKYGLRFARLKDNLCRVVVNATAARLEVIDFGGDKDFSARLWKIWKRNLMPRNAKKVHRGAIKSSKSYVVVWPDSKGKARIYHQEDATVYVERDPETGDINFAAKGWKNIDDNRYYLTLYYEDRIEKYITRDVLQGELGVNPDLVKRNIEGEEWPLVNEYSRIPVFEFDNDGSSLDDVASMQDALNKAWADLFVSMEYNAKHQRYAIGHNFKTDEETGKTIQPDGDSQWMAIKNAEAKIGEFTSDKLEEYLKVIGMVKEEIPILSSIPSHYFKAITGTFPSGEALRTAEARFTEIITEAQISFGETWAEVKSFCLEIEGDEAGQEVTVLWSDAAPVSETEMLDNSIKKLKLGWSIRQIQEDMGLSEAQIIKMATEVTEYEKSKATLNVTLDKNNEQELALQK